MSLPPEVITVRRKRRADADDGPVNFLRVEETKRQRSDTWLYRRKAPETQIAEQPSQILPERPIIHSSRPGHENVPITTPSHAAPKAPETRAGRDLNAPVAPPASSNAEPRRFHLSRFDIPDRAAGRGSKRSRYSSALFVERSGQRKKAEDQAPAVQEEVMHDVEMADVPARTQKRPGARARIPKAPEQKQPPRLPPSLRNRQYDTSTEALSRDMESWALEHITHNLARQEEERARHPATHTTPTKYRPKAPAKRFAERHPEVASASKEDGDVDMDDHSETEDEDYIVETYVRVPATSLQDAKSEQVGVLVFDQGSDVEYFYGVESDSEDEYLEDDEDSNDENYYTADYPEDEVASDDEYGRDDYHFRTENASDKEEFDNGGEDEVVKSDDEAGLPGTRLWREQNKLRSKLGLPKLK